MKTLLYIPVVLAIWPIALLYWHVWEPARGWIDWARLRIMGKAVWPPCAEAPVAWGRTT